MMKIFFGGLLIFLLLINCNTTLSQWVLQLNSDGRPVVKIQFIDQQTGWASSVGYQTFVSLGNFYKTTNGGETWSKILDGYESFPDLQFLNSNTGWLLSTIVSTDYITTTSKLRKTTNGGNNWQDNVLLNEITSFHFSDQDHGYLTLNHGKIYKTVNGGINWQQIRDSVDNSFRNKIYFLDNINGFLLENFNIKKTTNGGNSWNIVFNTSDYFIFSNIQFILNNGWISALEGNKSYLFRTTNYGNSWDTSLIYQNSEVYINNYVFMTTDSTGYYTVSNDHFSSVNNLIFRTTNKGISWINIPNLFHDPVKSSFFITDSIGWLGGGLSVNTYGRSAIFKTTSGGYPLGLITNSNNIPTSYSLSQNFPNPFNPVTSINFDIPNSSYTNLIVFDQIGREIQVLVNEQLSPGIYKFEWNAADYPSGIYFYKLQAGEFVETKKMVLIK